MDEIIDRLPDAGIEDKHRDASWQLLKLEQYKERYAKVEIIIQAIIRRLSNPLRNKSKNNFDQIIKNLDEILDMKKMFYDDYKME